MLQTITVFCACLIKNTRVLNNLNMATVQQYFLWTTSKQLFSHVDTFREGSNIIKNVRCIIFWHTFSHISEIAFSC